MYVQVHVQAVYASIDGKQAQTGSTNLIVLPGSNKTLHWRNFLPIRSIPTHRSNGH